MEKELGVFASALDLLQYGVFCFVLIIFIYLSVAICYCVYVSKSKDKLQESGFFS